ncbi:Syntaxin-7 [Aphanomyces cochlioides]|nr:Syntaxin-7 [Aphanomyces cochlioides]
MGQTREEPSGGIHLELLAGGNLSFAKRRDQGMGNDPYDSYDSPKAGVMPNEKYDKTIGEVSKAIGQLNATIRSIDQKVSLYGTSLDSRNNHEKLNELVEKGNKLVAKVQKRFKILNNDLKGQAGAVAKARTTTVKKLSADFKTQLDLFQKSCENVVSSETQAVNNIRRTSSSFVSSQKANNPVLSNYNEDQLYAQAQVTTYDEDDMIRREEDIIHINHQLREINAAYKEIDGLINDQHEVVVEIAGNVEDAQDNAHRALDQVRQADAKRSYCACSKRKMWCYGGLLLVLIVIILSVVLSLSK